MKLSDLKLLLLLLLAFCYSTAAAQVIPDERSVDWSNATESLSLELPEFEVNVMDFGASGDGSSDDQPAVMAAIASLEGRPGVVYLPEGKYLLRNPVTLRDSTVLRGDGAGFTELLFDLSKQSKNCIVIDRAQENGFILLDEGYTKNSTEIVSDSAYVFKHAEFALIYQGNGDWDDKPISWAKNAVGQILRIEEVDGNTISIHEPLRIEYSDYLHPGLRLFSPIRNAGVMCLSIKRLDQPTVGGGANIFIRNAAKCFIRGVESDTSAGSHIDIFRSINILVDGCYIHHAFEYDGASKHGYGVTLNNQSGGCLITNNVFEYLRHAMMVKTGANGNVFSYNYSKDVHRSSWPNNYGGDISLHGHYAYANLFEGNIVQNIIIDHYWGPSGPLNTFFRNRAELYGIIMTVGDPTTSDRQNIVGNEITNESFFYGQYMLTGSGHFEHGNHITGDIIPEGTDVLDDSSYYLTDKPTFWNISDKWPSIGIPEELGEGDIPARQRYMSGASPVVCPDMTITSMEDIKLDGQHIQVWPNPACSFVNILCKNMPTVKKEVTLTDTKGKALLKEEFLRDRVSVQLHRIPNPGLYFIQVRSAQSTVTKKLLISR